MFPSIIIYDTAAKELLLRCREDNPGLNDDEVRRVADEAIAELSDRMCRKYYEYGKKLTVEQIAHIVALGTGIGLTRETSLQLYKDIEMGLQKPVSKTPHH